MQYKNETLRHQLKLVFVFFFFVCVFKQLN